VTIKNIEVEIIEKAYADGLVFPEPPGTRTGKTVAVIGSGPAGLACADQLNKMGHQVTVYEKHEEPGGLLTFGIPDFKLEKWVVSRRTERMAAEGVVFKTGVHVGVAIGISELRLQYDAIVLAGGAEAPRELQVPGRDLKGVHHAMEFLPQQNRINSGLTVNPSQRISGYGKNVVVLGGGDTGADCIGTLNRQGAKSIRQFEIMPRPPRERDIDNPWPWWGFTYRLSPSHEEGVIQDYCIMTKELIGEAGRIRKLRAVRLEYGQKDSETGRRTFQEIPGSEFTVDCELLLLAMGFLGPVKTGMLEELNVELDQRGNVKTDANYMSNVKGVFAAGDMRRGQSLVVWAINEGRSCAEGVNRWLRDAKITR
jgi:glutamate synthase (NADPH/NADH) small chain